MPKIYQLDPRHTPLLGNHTAGYWWVRPRNPPYKYKGSIIYAEDFGAQLAKGVHRKITHRRLYPHLIRFKSHGYVYSGVDFILLMKTEQQTQDSLDDAKLAKKMMIKQMKHEARKVGSRKTLTKKYGSDFKGSTRNRTPIDQIKERALWVWGFQNKQLGKSFPHIFTYIDNGQPVGKSRILFANTFGLNFKELNKLAAGKIKAHRGWTLIGKPKRATHREAIAMKIKELVKS